MRWWTESIAALADAVPGGVPMLVFLSFVLAVLLSLALYFWPGWLPWNWRFRRGSRGKGRSNQRESRGWRRFRFGALRWRWRFRWRRRRRGERDALDDLPPDELPDMPAEVLALTADQLAAAGRYAEAVRERLRAIVRDLIERAVIPHTPGWTVTELAAAAGRARPALSPPLRGAADVFSEIWYGLRPATLDDDIAMRAHAKAVKQVLADYVQQVLAGSERVPAAGGVQ